MTTTGAMQLEELAARLPRLRLVEGQRLSFRLNISFHAAQAPWGPR